MSIRVKIITPFLATLASNLYIVLFYFIAYRSRWTKSSTQCSKKLPKKMNTLSSKETTEIISMSFKSKCRNLVFINFFRIRFPIVRESSTNKKYNYNLIWKLFYFKRQIQRFYPILWKCIGNMNRFLLQSSLFAPQGVKILVFEMSMYFIRRLYWTFFVGNMM